VELLGSVSYGTEVGSRSLAGRKIWLGLVAGTSVTDEFHVAMSDPPQVESRPYAAGLSVEVTLKERLSVEVDGLYRPLHAVIEYSNSDGYAFPFTVLTWQLPVLGKHRLAASNFAPFVEGGPSLRLSGNTNGYAPSRYGATVGCGVGTTARKVKLAPAVRYTRWAKDPYGYGTPQSDYSRTAANEVEILVCEAT
jgi:hypothetical protein